MPAYLKHRPTGDIYIDNGHLGSRIDMEPVSAKEVGYITGAQKRKANKPAVKVDAKTKVKTKTKVESAAKPATPDKGE